VVVEEMWDYYQPRRGGLVSMGTGLANYMPVFGGAAEPFAGLRQNPLLLVDNHRCGNCSNGDLEGKPSDMAY
jgi:hypothetical protein